MRPLLITLVLALFLIACYPARELDGSEHPKSKVLVRILSKKNNNRYLDCPKPVK